MEELVAQAGERSNRKGFDQFYHEAGPDDVDLPNFLDEMSGPALEYSAEGEEVSEPGVDIPDGE